jgi:hypothetical protein
MGPFVLSTPMLIAQTRVLLKRPFSKGERATYRLLAGAALAAGLAFRGDGIRTQGWQAAWRPNAIFRAIGFSAWQIGASLAAFTIALHTVEITLSLCTNRRAGFAL